MSNEFPALLQNYFLKRLLEQKKASSNTIERYRDTFRLFLNFLSSKNDVSPSAITMEMIDANAVADFFKYLEEERGNTAKTINNRLAAIKAFMEYASYEAPEYLGTIRKALAVPFRHAEKKEICYLEHEEIQALLNVCDESTTEGLCDKLMLQLLYNTGMRISELLALRTTDFSLPSKGIYTVTVLGKGRKKRTVPIWSETAKLLKAYFERRTLTSSDFLFCGRNVMHLTRSGARCRLDQIFRDASDQCASLKGKHLTPHVFRHTTALHLLQSGVDLSTIAIWLGMKVLKRHISTCPQTSS